MDLITRFKEQARKSPKRIVFPEGEDERIIEAAAAVSREGIAEPILLGNRERIEQTAAEKRIDINSVFIIAPPISDKLEHYAVSYCEQRKNIAVSVARYIVKKPVFWGAMMVSCGDADGMVAGIAHKTAYILQVSALAIGCEQGVLNPSSFFIMVVPEVLGEKDKVLIFADCAVSIDPSAEQLADIAVASGNSARALLGLEPKIALVSFSTKGSASHGVVDKVVRATEIARQKSSDIKIDGELQVDAALIKEIAARKVKDSDVAGQANVLVFPDLNTGNVAYKLTQYLAKAKAYGPILQGFKKPVNDLSRGASVEDIIALSAITVIQVNRSQNTNKEKC
ncbi:MAG: phosphate acetyltransferase [Candidatus Omnitrophica bacterium]|nr:phosphate acetyltransferase [Candidatus Omnitrophota bacterium]